MKAEQSMTVLHNESIQSSSSVGGSWDVAEGLGRAGIGFVPEMNDAFNSPYRSSTITEFQQTIAERPQPPKSKSVFQKLRQLAVDSYVAIRLNNKNLPYSAGVLDEEGVLEARQWVAKVYEDHGMIGPADLKEDGTLNDEADPYLNRSVSYGVRKKTTGELLMAARLILPEDNDVHSLQMHVQDLPSEQQQRLQQISGSVGEFASFIKKPGLNAVDSRFASLFLIRNILRDSVNRLGVNHWVFTMNPGVASSYQRIFGNSMTRLGENVGSGQFTIKHLTAFCVNVAERLQALKADNFSTVAAYALKKFLSESNEFQPVQELDNPARTKDQLGTVMPLGPRYL